MKAPSSALAVLTCPRATVCVYVQHRPSHDFPYAIYSWDSEYNNGEGQFTYHNGWCDLGNALTDAGNLLATQVQNNL